MKQWLKRWRSWRNKATGMSRIRESQVELVREIHRAHMEWLTAHRRLDYVLEKEQVDYAVFALEAAEKRFEMLIKQAKTERVTQEEVRAGREVQKSS